MSDFGSIIAQVFSERGVLQMFFGALGGAVRSAAIKTTWRDGLRVIFIGSATSFGIGALAPVFLSGWVQDLPESVEGSLGSLCAMSFIVGLVSVTLIERMIEK